MSSPPEGFWKGITENTATEIRMFQQEYFQAPSANEYFHKYYQYIKDDINRKSIFDRITDISKVEVRGGSFTNTDKPEKPVEEETPIEELQYFDPKDLDI